MQKQDVGKWQVKLNNLDIYSKNGDAITFEMDATTSSSNTSPGKIAPGSSVYSDITLDPTGTDVAVRYDITINATDIEENGFEIDLELQNAEGGETTSRKLIQTDINTYTGVLSLDEIKKGTQEVIRVVAKWVNDENNNDADTQKGLKYGTNLQIPVEIACSQYLGEEIKEDKLGTATNVEKYGWKVNAYKSADATAQQEAGAWRLFYQTRNYTYLISDNLIFSGASLQNLYTKAGWDGKTGANVSKIGQLLNPMFKEVGGFTTNNTNGNIKAVGYLTDPKQWEKYKNEDSIFAIGGPTLQLFIESFNETSIKENRNITLNPIIRTGGYLWGRYILSLSKKTIQSRNIFK